MQCNEGCPAFVWQMRRGHAVLWSATVALALLASLTPGCLFGSSSIDERVQLRGTGPYRGQVLDAATKQPIAGAVVAAIWYYSSSTVGGDLQHFHDALEVFTDAQGYFTVDAPAIERRAPRRTIFPDFTIFKPGYTYFKGWFAPPEAMADRRNQTLLGTVELKPLTNRKERLESWRALEAFQGSDAEARVPLLIKALGEERRALGLGN